MLLQERHLSCLGLNLFPAEGHDMGGPALPQGWCFRKIGSLLTVLGTCLMLEVREGGV